MPSEPPPDAVESLRIALLKIEHAPGPACHKAAVAHLRLRLLNHLADREAERALIKCLAPDQVEIAQIVERAALMPPLSLAELQTLEEGTAEAPPHELD
jgi:hypothetical protein